MIYDVEEIPLKEIIVSKRTLSRRTGIGKDISSLIQSIKKVGLLQPIGVYPLEYKKYVLLYGQRRLLAVKRLGWKKILASIII